MPAWWKPVLCNKLYPIKHSWNYVEPFGVLRSMLAAIQLRFRPSLFRQKESSLHLKLNRNFPRSMYIFINNFFNRGEPNFSFKKSLLFLDFFWVDTETRWYYYSVSEASKCFLQHVHYIHKRFLKMFHYLHELSKFGCIFICYFYAIVRDRYHRVKGVRFDIINNDRRNR